MSQKARGTRSKRVAKVMEEGVKLFSNKNDDYGDAYVLASDVMQILVPDKSKVVTRTQQIVYHNMYVIVCKLLRACNLLFNEKFGEQKVNDEAIADSLRDGGVYFNMIAEVVDDRANIEQEFGQ